MRVARVVLLLLAFTVTAHAESNVDWSQYIETPSDKPLDVHATAPKDDVPVRVATSSMKTATKAKHAKVAKKSKARRTKARAKKRARK